MSRVCTPRRRAYLLTAAFLATIFIIATGWVSSSSLISDGSNAAYLRNPAVSDDDTHWIFGYGSLISASSRTRTGQTSSEHTPVRIHGLQRLWNYEATTMTAVGVIRGFERDVSTNGVLVKVKSADQVLKFDLRERNYRRTEVLLDNIAFLDNQNRDSPDSKQEFNRSSSALGGSRVWFYQIADPLSSEWRATEDKPIAQSYVDVMLEGCLLISDAFAREFIKTTFGWQSGPWIDDRQGPLLYERGNVGSPFLKKIDALLAEIVPEAFRARTPIELAAEKPLTDAGQEGG